MKKILLSLTALTLVLLSSCSGSKEPSALISLCETLNGEFKDMAKTDYMLFNDCAVDYAEGTVNVTIDFAEGTYTPDEFSDALVQFVVSQYLKEHLGERLDTFINTLSKEKGALRITLAGAGQKKDFDIPAARLVKLVKLKPMELSYNDARANVIDIMAKRCDTLAKEVKAKSADFSVANSFAQYTFTFEKSAPYAKLTQAQLNSTILKCMKPVFDTLGNEGAFVKDLLSTFKIDGYRFVYENEKDKYVLKSSLPWRLFKEETIKE